MQSSWMPSGEDGKCGSARLMLAGVVGVLAAFMLPVPLVVQWIGLLGGLGCLLFGWHWQRQTLEVARHEAELKLLEFREMVETANDGIVLVDDGLIVECNPATERLYGLSREAIIGQNAVQLSSILLDDGSETVEPGQAYVAGAYAGQAQRFLWQHKRPDGSVFIAESILNPAKSIVVPGQPERKRFVAVLRDVTEAQRAAEAQRASEQRFRQLFELAPIGLSLSAADGRVQALNRVWVEQQGYTLAEVPDVEHWLILAIPDANYRAEVRSLIARDLKRLRARGGEQLMLQEYRVRVKSGEERNFLIGGVLIGDSLMTSFTDVTELRATQAELQTLNANLEGRVEERTRALRAALDDLQKTQRELVHAEKLAGLGALVAGVSHELNTPIGNAVMVASTLSDLHYAFSESVKQGLRKSALDKFIADWHEATDVLERNLRRAAELISSFKQVAVDQSSYQRRTFELSDVLHELQVTLSPTLRRSNISLIETVGTGMRMDSFPGPLTQVLMNIVNNAVVHAFEGRESGCVEIVGQPLEGSAGVRLTVRDNGCGIAAEHLPHVFDPFFTTRLGRGGSGLGLHIVYTLVTDILGGSVRVEVLPGEGTTFIIELPLQAPRRAGNDAGGII